MSGCGTYAGAQAHGRLGEPKCDACREAARLYMRAFRSRKPRPVYDQIAGEVRAKVADAIRVAATDLGLRPEQISALVKVARP